MVQTSGKKVSKISQNLHEFLKLSDSWSCGQCHCLSNPFPNRTSLVSSPVNAAQGSTSNASLEVGAVVAREADLSRACALPTLPRAHPHPAHYRFNIFQNTFRYWGSSCNCSCDQNVAIKVLSFESHLQILEPPCLCISKIPSIWKCSESQRIFPKCPGVNRSLALAPLLGPWKAALECHQCMLADTKARAQAFQEKISLLQTCDSKVTTSHSSRISPFFPWKPSSIKSIQISNQHQVISTSIHPPFSPSKAPWFCPKLSRCTNHQTFTTNICCTPGKKLVNHILKAGC